MEIIIRTKQLRKLHSRSVYQVMRFEPVDKHAGSCESRSQTWEPRLGLCRDDFYTQPSPFQTPFVDLKRVHIFRDVSSLSRPWSNCLKLLKTPAEHLNLSQPCLHWIAELFGNLWNFLPHDRGTLHRVALHSGSRFEPRDWSTPSRNVTNFDSNCSHAWNNFIFTHLFSSFHFPFGSNCPKTCGTDYERAKMCFVKKRRILNNCKLATNQIYGVFARESKCIFGSLILSFSICSLMEFYSKVLCIF